MNKGCFGFPSSQGGQLFGWRSSLAIAPGGFAVNTARAFSHPFGKHPVLTQVVIRNVIAESTYLPPDDVFLIASATSGPSNNGVIGVDERKFTISQSNSAIALSLKTTGAYAGATVANWIIGASAVFTAHPDLGGLNKFTPLVPFSTGKRQGLSAGLNRFAHPGGRKPFFVQLMGECIKADGLFKPGDISTFSGSAVLSAFLVIVHDASGLAVCASSATAAVTNGLNGGTFTADTSKWMFYLQGIA